jgi:hypothetical protein
MVGQWRSFQNTWFDEFDWLDYNESKDAAYCLYCYLFFNSGKTEKFGSAVFAHQGYQNWKNAKDTFHKHSASKTHTDMDKEINVRGTPRRRKQKVTNLHYYHVELFVVAIDALLAEMNHRFSETSSELLVCMVAFNPRKIL